MNYRCADLLVDYKPPDRSVRITDERFKCDDTAVNGDKCRYTCMGSIDTVTQLDEQFLTLYDYSPDNSDNMLNYTEYTCKTSVKVLLKFHGKLLKGQAFPKIILSENMSPDTTFKLITYTRQGECLDAQSIRASCNDNYGSIPVETFTREFYDVGLETDSSVHSSGNFGMIICLNTTETEDFATISGKFLSRAADTSNYEENLQYYDIRSINRLVGRSEDDNSFYLSELVPALKRMYPGRNINLHLLTCLELDVQPGDTFTYEDIIQSEPLYTRSYEWVEEYRNDCEDLPICSYEEQEGLDLSQCNPGDPKSIRYLDRQDDTLSYQHFDFESSQCILKCLPGYDPTPLPNKSDRGNCYSYHDGTTLYTEYLNFNDGNLTKLGINCIPQNTCATN